MYQLTAYTPKPAWNKDKLAGQNHLLSSRRHSQFEHGKR